MSRIVDELAATLAATARAGVPPERAAVVAASRLWESGAVRLAQDDLDDMRQARDSLIRELFNGRNHRQLASLFCITSRQIYRIANPRRTA